ncbi:hypothetical protein TNCV_4459761 [Trichonephila clavipes]|nr:hypothetical protein TNCV_4459761 [Trichonephila clavipes]
MKLDLSATDDATLKGSGGNGQHPCSPKYNRACRKGPVQLEFDEGVWGDNRVSSSQTKLLATALRLGHMGRSLKLSYCYFSLCIELKALRVRNGGARAKLVGMEVGGKNEEKRRREREEKITESTELHQKKEKKSIVG